MGQSYPREKLKKGIWDKDIDLHPEDEYVFVYGGYKCMIKRNTMWWTYCGYVYLPITHPDYSKKYTDIDKEISVHGDLSFGDGDGVFGFDCHHILMGDISPVEETMIDDPKYGSLYKTPELILNKPHYWTYEDTKEETIRMVKQFKARE